MSSAIHFVTKDENYAAFVDGGYAHVCLCDWQFKNGLKLVRGNMTIYNSDGKIIDCITRLEFEVRYGLRPVRNGA